MDFKIALVIKSFDFNFNLALDKFAFGTFMNAIKTK